jgi:hypothetical protein
VNSQIAQLPGAYGVQVRVSKCFERHFYDIMYSIPGLNQSTLDRNRQSRRILADVRERRQESWSWIVYRITYKSDPAFGKAIDIINSRIKREVYRDMLSRNGLSSEKNTRGYQACGNEVFQRFVTFVASFASAAAYLFRVYLCLLHLLHCKIDWAFLKRWCMAGRRFIWLRSQPLCWLFARHGVHCRSIRDSEMAVPLWPNRVWCRNWLTLCWDHYRPLGCWSVASGRCGCCCLGGWNLIDGR